LRSLLAASLILIAAGLFGQTPKKTGATPAPTPAKKATAPAPKTSTAKKAPAKSTTTTAAKKTAAKKTVAKRKTTAKKRVVARRRTQAHPTPERYTEIQEALIGRGLLQGPATGRWEADSVAALKQFQTSQKLEPNGKINALSLIRLGLGPKREAVAQGGRLPPSEPKEPAP
jgi:hypothetical protein